MCGVVDGGIVAGLYGYEAGQSGVGDIFAWYVENQVPRAVLRGGRRRGHRRPRAPHRTRLPRAGRRARTRRARLARRQPLGARRPRALRRCCVGTTLTTRARGDLPRAARGDGVRHPHDRRDLQRRRRAGDRVHRRGRPAQEPRSSCRPTPTCCACRSRRSRASRARRSARRSTRPSPPAPTPTCTPRGEAMGKVDAATPTCPTPHPPTPTTGSYAEYRELHDYFGRGANDVMKRLKARRREADREAAPS